MPYTVRVGEALQQAEEALRTAGLDTPRLDAEVLLAHVLDVSRTELLARLTTPLPANARTTFEDLIDRRVHHEPVAYLTHHKEFYGLDFYVDWRVLIPRSETELLVDHAIQISDTSARLSTGFGFRILRPGSAQVSNLHIADVGTGSGCVAVALAVHLLQARVYATEASSEAMEVARINIERHAVGERVQLVHSDLLRDVDPAVRFDIIVANLPYVSESEMAELPRSVRDYEPVAEALEAGPDGLGLIRRLLDQVPARLQPEGVVLLEIGWQQGAAASELARQRFPDADVRVLPDLAGRDRVVEIREKR